LIANGVAGSGNDPSTISGGKMPTIAERIKKLTDQQAKQTKAAELKKTIQQSKDALKKLRGK
jgi:hypothetical protein